MKRMNIAAMTLSAASLIGIAVHEGYSSKAYNDSVGVKTIGFGTTANVKQGDTITVERALVRLLQDADKHQQGLKECIGDVALYQYELDAYTSWAYNVGVGAACKSTLVKKLKQTPPDYEGACKELLKWDRAGGKVLPGLTKRRQQEHQQCIGANK